MPLRSLSYGALAVGACAALGGCGSASPPASVQLSLTAPVNGATVVVPRIVVFGTIEPKNARVTVAGKTVQVSDGAFRQSLSLKKRLTTIDVRASASGYVGSSTEVEVHYAPAPPARAVRHPQPGAGGGARAIASVDATSGGGGQASGYRPTSTAERDFLTGCARTNAQVTGCECVYSQLVKAGFVSEARWEALLLSWRRSFLANGTIVYPSPVRNAILACAAQF